MILLITIMYQPISAQQFIEYPPYHTENQTFKTAVSFFIPDRNQVMVLHNGQYQMYNSQGNPIGAPVAILQLEGDVKFPSVSRSGKKILFYSPSSDVLKKQGISVFDTDSGYVLGTYEIDYFDQIERTRFLGDSILNIYSRDDKTLKLATWNLLNSQLKLSRMVEEEDGFFGTPDLTVWGEGLQLVYRKQDTLAFINRKADGNNDPYLKIIPLSSVRMKLDIRYSNGFPYAVVVDPSAKKTSFFSAPDSIFVDHATLNCAPTIIAAEGSPEHCYVLYLDSSKKAPFLSLFEAVRNKITTTTIPAAFVQTHFIHLFIEKDLIVASHRLNGRMEAYSISTGSLLWSFSPNEEVTILKDTTVNALPADLFKVMMKQGTKDVSGICFDQKNNQLLLIKKNEQLITVDARSETGVQWESFYQEGSRIISSKLLPGNRFINIEEEYWKKDETSTFENYEGKIERDENLNAKNYIYPNGYKIYDRVKGKVIFNIKTKGLIRIKIINDSLIAWSQSYELSAADSITILNLHTGKVENNRPPTKGAIGDYEIAFANNQFLFLTAQTNQQIQLINAAGKILFTRKQSYYENVLENVAFTSNAAFLYFKTESSKELNQVYRILKDTVELAGKIPVNIIVLDETTVKDQLYFLYAKQIKTTKEEEYQFRFFHLNSGKDKLIETISSENFDKYKDYQLYPSASYYTEINKGIVTWKALNNGVVINEFGRSENSIASITYSADGRYLAAGSPVGEVMLWDLGTGKETKSLRVANEGYITKLAFSGDGKYIAASSGDIWETATGKNVVSVTDGGIWAVNSIDFSNDGKRIISAGACIISWDAADGSKLFFQQYPGKNDMDSTNNCWNPNGCVDPAFKYMAHSTAFHPNNKDFVVGNKSGIVQKWNTENDSLYTAKILPTIPTQIDNNIFDIKYSRNGNYVVAVQEKMMYKLNGNTLAVEDSLQLNTGEKILGIDVDYEGEYIGCITKIGKEYVAQLRSFSTLKVVHQFTTDGGAFNKISFSPNKKHLATASEDGFCTIWDYKKLAPVMYLNSMGAYGNVMVTPDNFYMASKSALEGVNFFKDGQFYSFDQFDLYLNRPDVVLGKLGYANQELIRFYRNAYLKRLKKVTGNTSDTSMKDYVPEISVSNRTALPAVISSGTIPVSLQIKDTAKTKGKLNIFINGNLVQTSSFNNSNDTMLLYNDSLFLTQGQNNIEFMYRDHASIESRKEKLAVTYAPEKPLPSKVWYFGIGISDYKNKDMDLRYPVKDIRDMVTVFKKKYPSIIIDTLMNENASKVNIMAIRNKLLQTSIEDKVIISFSGHGLLSDSLDWYFASAGVDFKHPETSGLPYDQMENLLAGIPARKKLLLLDACHSGEVDKEEDITFSNVETAMDDSVVINPAQTRGNILIGKSKAGLQTSFEMMQELFANLNYGNGTTVLSAAGGREYALESDEWKNGVFTYSLLKSIQNEKTDQDGNKKISIRELKAAVFEKVIRLTGGRQKPTSRVEIMDDWYIWE